MKVLNMKAIQLFLLFAVVAIVAVCWRQTMVRLDKLEREVASIEARPVSLQDDTKRCLEDLCKKVASESASEAHQVMSDKLKESCDRLVQGMMDSQNVLDMLAEVVSNDWNSACGEMVSDGKECLQAVKDEIEKMREAVRDDAQKCLQATENAISKIANLTKSKSDAYLAAARGNTNDYQVCELLYRAAILFADEKKPLLTEYATICQRFVKDLAERGRVDEARSRSASLIEFFDGVIGTGSVDDICSIPELTHQLASIKELVDEAERRVDDDMIAVVDEIEGAIRSATNYEQCVECRTKLADLDLPADAINRKDQLDQLLSTKMAVLTPPTMPLSFPPIGEETPWLDWLESYKKRLNRDELNDEARVRDIASAEEFLTAAKDVDDENVRAAAAEVDKLGAEICRRVWRKNVLEATSKAKDSPDAMQKCMEMLAASVEFSEDEKELCRDEIISLNRTVVTASLRELRQQAESAKELKSKLTTDEYQQILSMIQGECFHILLKLQSLNQQFKGGFDADIDRVSVAISGFTSVMTGFRKEREVSDMKNQEECNRRFLSWVDDRINYAEMWYDLGEKKAKEWLATTSNDEAQRHYHRAWVAIMEVNQGDLVALDPALERRWSKMKEKIEKRYTPTDDDLKNRTYRGRDSFR